MLPVEILPVQETVVLRARGSELLILPQHVKNLKALTKSRDFSQYFRDEALVNRPARKLFEAWLRKDHTLWQRLYTTIHKQMNLTGSTESPEAVEVGVPSLNEATSSSLIKASESEPALGKAPPLSVVSELAVESVTTKSADKPKKKASTKKDTGDAKEATPKKKAVRKTEKPIDETPKPAATKKSGAKPASRAAPKAKSKG